MPVSDATLVLGSLSGDPRAFGELYDRYARLVRAICYDETHDVSRAQDLAQEVFLRAYQKMNSLKEPEKFGPWLVAMTRNVCREFRRSRARDRHQLIGLVPPEKGTTTPEPDPEGRLEKLAAALGALSEKERLALHIYYLQEQEIEQAQELIGVSRSAFYRLLTSAKKKVEEFIKKQERASERHGRETK